MLAGIVAVITPEFVEANEPITVGLVKFPSALLSCAEKTLPVLKLPVVVNETDSELPGHKDEATLPVLMIEAIVKFAKNPSKTKNRPVFFTITNYLTPLRWLPVSSLYKADYRAQALLLF